jgi:hypothetical protein
MTTTQTGALESGHLDDTPVQDTVLRQFLHNQADLNALLAEAGGGEVRRSAAAVVTGSPSPVRYLKQTVALRPLTGLDDPVLDEAEDVADRWGGQTLLSAWPTPDLTRRGWQLVGHPTFVVRPPQPPRPYDRDRVSVVATEAELELATRVVVEGYPMPEATDATLYPPSVLGSELLVRIGWLGGRPVAAAASHPAHGVQQLCLAATLPEARRQGVWEALALARLADRPELPAVSFTSDYSRKGFEKLGFLPVARLTLWLR